ncbi:MAG: aldehyde dehydrogenase family protein [candidate division WOR-3 bacterium]
MVQVLNPYSDSVIAEVSIAGPAEVEQALAGAEAGAEAVRRLPAHRRTSILARCAELVEARKQDFTDTIIAEAGKPRRYAEAETNRAIETIRFAASEASRVHGETIPMDACAGSENRRGFFIRIPLGIIAAITPFNFPLNLVVHKVAPALAAGNSVILKPASATPLSALKLGEILLEAGLPPAALNILIGPGSTVGTSLVKDRRVRMVTFTGSAAVGEKIKAESGLKRVALELGSNSGAIIDETADFDKALGRCLVGGFSYSGQVCIHTQRLYLHEAIAERFTGEFVVRAQKLRCGDPALRETEIGPMIDRAALDKGIAFVEQARQQGAQVLCGGKAEGNIMLPTVITSVRPEMSVVCEETFAPIVTIETFSDFDEAIRMFNRGSQAGTYQYGLACGVFTRDLSRAMRAAEELAVGNVYINDSATFRADIQPYGGVRDSGLGREGPRFAIEEMTDIRFVSFNLDA